MIANIKICRKCEWCVSGLEPCEPGKEPSKKLKSFDCVIVNACGGDDRIGQKHGAKYVANKQFEVPTDCPFWLEQTVSK